VDELDESGVCNVNLLSVVGLLYTAINMLMACLMKYLKCLFDIVLSPFVCNYNHNYIYNKYNMIFIFFQPEYCIFYEGAI